MQPGPLEEVIDDRDIACDLIIVGGGPAGIALANEFAGSEHRVILLDSGDGAPVADDGNDYEAEGPAEVIRQLVTRHRRLGGNTHLWMGKVAAFDEIDYAYRSWVPYSGWPISPGDLAAYVDRAASALNLGPNIYDERLWSSLNRRSPTAEIDPDVLQSVFWQFSKSRRDALQVMRFDEELTTSASTNLRVLTGATVTRINTDSKGRVFESVEVCAPSGRRAVIRGRAVALAAGGIDNARLLLASNHICSSGLGNEQGQVGRYLMTHLRCRLGSFSPKHLAKIQERLGFFYIRERGRSIPYLHGLRLGAAFQERTKLMNAAAFINQHRSDSDPWDALKRLLLRKSSSFAGDLFTFCSQPTFVAGGLFDRIVRKRGLPHKVDSLSLECLIEQRPDADNRLTLSTRCDRYGVPIPHVRWRIADQEAETAVALGRAIAGEFRRIGSVEPEVSEWVESGDTALIPFETVAHPTGTTRMSLSPLEGVVNTACRLHMVEGVYVTGSSVFPTSGHANPTLMIVAFALRLADELKNALAARESKGIRSLAS